jgi:hypothetical protein
MRGFEVEAPARASRPGGTAKMRWHVNKLFGAYNYAPLISIKASGATAMSAEIWP